MERLRQQDDVDVIKTKEFYVLSWRALLRNMLRWPDNKIEEWVKAMLDEKRNPWSLIPTETPAYHVVWEIFPAAFKKKMSGDLDPVAREIERAILQGRWKVDEFSEPDWTAARERVNRL